MRVLLLIYVIITTSYSTSGQARPDSMQQNIEVRMDSIQNKIVQLPDTLLPAYQKVDSIRRSFNDKANSLRAQYQTALSKLVDASNKINNRIDSLDKLNKPTSAAREALDSLNHLRQQRQEKFSARLDEIKSKTTGKLNALDLPPEYKEQIQALTGKIEGVNLNTANIKIAELSMPGFSMPKLNGIGDFTSQAGELGTINSKLDLPNVKSKIGVPGEISQQAQAYQEDIKNITEGNLEDVQRLPETIEQQASRIEGVDELQKQSGVIDEQKARLDELADPDKAKEKAIEMAKEAAVDHFAGKQEQLKAAMDKISKYKQKYSSVSSIKDLPKRPPNAMKGKPIIERLVPGLYFQYQQKNFYLIDVNPYLGFKISGRFTSGVGWNHRYAYDKDSHSFISRTRIYGPRGYVDFKLGKGFIAHVEGEAMNTFVPSTLLGNPDTGQREWVWSFMTGIKKEYRIYKNLKGTALIQYNLFNRYYKAPYVDRLNSRIGFEYVLKKKRVKK